jgi:RHS repeat-associated protein
VEYTYDALGRRLTMDVPGQAQISYDWDDADRLLTITQGSNVVAFEYDNANRRTKLTYPSGTFTEYAYDNASRLTGLTYKHGSNTLGALTYTYDAASQRVQVGGSWARTGLPAALSSAIYNAANHQTAFGSQTLTYDLNGNLTGDGTNTYTWNARNQLSALSGPVAGSFVYDAFGRRQRKTIDSVITDFVYDGLNPVRQAVGSDTADLLTGLGIDEYFVRADSSATRDLLTDALGSTVSLADSSGAVQTEYSYEPFGMTTTSGSTSGNELRYTGREEDGTGVYYYRARYYHPGLQRFIAEDPIGFAGGDVNLYAYVQNTPGNYRDPLGLELVGLTAGLSGFAGFGQVRPGAVNVSGTFGASLGLTRRDGCVVGHGTAYSGGTGMTSWDPMDQKGGSVYGLSFGKGLAAFYSNADSFAELQGPFDTLLITAAAINIQVDTSTDPKTGKTTYVVSLSPGFGLGFATLRTNTPATTDSPSYPCESGVLAAGFGGPNPSIGGRRAGLAGRK